MLNGGNETTSIDPLVTDTAEDMLRLPVGPQSGHPVDTSAGDLVSQSGLLAEPKLDIGVGSHHNARRGAAWL